ncbi:MAG: transglycosylase SLT domain-containing protein [Sphingopyxis sp.]|nr:transglycosylase SLT domain-containing protein [Sphingopyxis sp.]
MNAINNPLGAARSTVPVMDAVQTASARTGVDFNYLVDVARVESGYNPTAKAATSSARGLFQFTKQTWLATLDRHGADYGLGWAADAIGRDASGRLSVTDPALRQQIFDLRDDPGASSNMAAALTGDNRAYLESRIGRSAEPVDLYLAHFLGSGGAAKFLSALEANPDQPGAPMMPEAAAANRSVFYAPDGSMRSLAEIRDRFRVKLEEGGSTENGKPLAPAGWLMAASSSSGLADSGGGRPPLPMMDIQPMPKKLSMGFAADAYRRLASLSGGAA